MSSGAVFVLPAALLPDVSALDAMGSGDEELRARGCCGRAGVMMGVETGELIGGGAEDIALMLGAGALYGEYDPSGSFVTLTT